MGCYNTTTKQELFYNILEEKSGFKIDGDYQLLNLITRLSKVKTEYDKVESALNDAKLRGYGVVAPSLDELSLEEPEIVKQGKQYGIKLKANAPSLHIIRADLEAGEVSPERLVTLGCWDEFGEGHIIYPTEGLGFRYLDAIRSALTTGGEHTDVIPKSLQFI